MWSTYRDENDCLRTDAIVINPLQHVIDCLKTLDSKKQEELLVLITENRDQYAQLSQLMGSLLSKIPADIEVKTGPVEDKRVSWIYSLEETDETLSDFAVLYDRVRALITGTRTVLIADEQDEHPKRHYSVSSRFLALYSVKLMLLENTRRVDLGCAKCKVCHSHHRALHLKVWGEELELRITESKKEFTATESYFSEKEWRSILRPVPGQCVLNGRSWLPAAKRADGTAYNVYMRFQRACNSKEEVFLTV